jgi:hypothetical protein
MFGHGQLEGFAERYGMEYRRSYHEETPDPWLVARHEREISPLLHHRALFAEVRDFLLYDFFTDDGWVNEDVFAYSNRLGDERALVVYHNRYATTRGWVRISCGYSEKTPDGGKRVRQRTLGESFGLSDDSSMFIAYRDAFSGLEYLHRSPEIAEKGLHLELQAYKCRVLMDWRDLHDDGTRPWGALCDMLAGHGVTSLDDALRALELKPVHDALRTLLDPALARALADFVSAVDSLNREPEVRSQYDSAKKDLLENAAGRVRPLLEAVRQFAARKEREAAVGWREWRGDLDSANRRFTQQLSSALRVPQLERYFSAPWTEEARAVLPSVNNGRVPQLAIWSTILAWCALDALGEYHNPADPGPAAAALFDALRLREPMAEAFAAAGLHDEKRWRAAARVRAAFAHASLVSETDPKERPPGAAPFTWLHDPDVAWLVGVHEYQGTRYLVKESLERLLWWMALRRLLMIAQADKPDVEAIRRLEHRLRARMNAAAESGYQVEALFEPGR